MHHNLSKIGLQNTSLLRGISIIIIKFIDDHTSLLNFWIGLVINNDTIVLYYTNSETIDCEFRVCYNHPLEKGVSINNIITFEKLKTKLCLSLLILIILTPS